MPTAKHICHGLLLMVVCAMHGGCSQLPPVTEHYRQLQVGVDDKDVQPFAEPAKMTLYYVTNRASSTPADVEPYFGPDVERKVPVQFGTIEALVPRLDPVGGIRPFDVAQGSLDANTGVKLKPPQRAVADAKNDLSAFVRELKKTHPASKPILLFVHGYNNDFSFATKRAARFVYDMGGSEHFTPLVFSWPAYGVVTAVTIDENNTGLSSIPLANLLGLLLSGDDARAVHLIAHSMGTRVISQALLRLAASGVQVKPIKNLIIASGDMDAMEFSMPEQIKLLRDRAERVSIYICDQDVALSGSMFLHSPLGHERRRARIGQGGENRTVIAAPNIDTIDASMVEQSSENHAYLFENRRVIDDVFMLLRHDLAPAQRNLLKARDGDDQFFLIRR